MTGIGTLGIVGGNGALGGAIAQALLSTGAVRPADLWIASRSGRRPAFPGAEGLRVAKSNQELAEACDLVLLSVPPAQVGAIAIDAGDRLVVSVMAGITLERIAAATGAKRIVRAMSSPAAARRLAYSPWCAGEGAGDADKARVRRLFEACGKTDEVPDERQLDHFTAMTGPVPGFVALYADCMIRYAVNRGIDPAVAERAIRQLFLASGEILAEEEASPAEQVRAMIDYAGTTAAGLKAMEDSPLEAAIERGLEAACRAARRMGGETP